MTLKQILLKPAEFQCSFADAPCGLLLWGDSTIVMKSVAVDADGYHMAIQQDGQEFTAGTSYKAERQAVQVLPLQVVVSNVTTADPAANTPEPAHP